MNKPQLYYALFSPPVRACMITAKVIGLDLELKPVDFAKKEHFNDEFLELNPQHQIPVFVDTDGEIYIDSHAIICFMVSKYAQDDSLYPKDLKKRAHVDHRLYYENGVLFQVIKDIGTRFLYGGDVDFNPISLQLCHDAYAVLEKFLEKGDYVVGNSMTVADISINTTLITLNILIPVEKERYPRICAWMERLESLPDYQNVNEEGAKILATYFTSKMLENREKSNKK